MGRQATSRFPTLTHSLAAGAVPAVVALLIPCTSSPRLAEAAPRLTLLLMDPTLERNRIEQVYRAVSDWSLASHRVRIADSLLSPDLVWFPRLNQEVTCGESSYFLAMPAQFGAQPWLEIVQAVDLRLQSESSSELPQVGLTEARRVVVSPVWTNESQTLFVLYCWISTHGRLEAGETVCVTVDSATGEFTVTSRAAFIV